MPARLAAPLRARDAPPAVAEPSRPGPAPIPGAPLVEVRDLRFTYPGESRPALDGVSLCLERAGGIAVVGPTLGKSTLATSSSLLGGAARNGPSPGHDIREWPSTTPARVPSPPSAPRVHGSLRRNLLGPAGAATTTLAVLRAVRLDALVERVPGGSTRGSARKASASRGGERQRLALARALCGGAPPSVLDEPTLTSTPSPSTTCWPRSSARARAGPPLSYARLVSLDAFDEVGCAGRRPGRRTGAATDLLARGGVLARLWRSSGSVDALATAFGRRASEGSVRAFDPATGGGAWGYDAGVSAPRPSGARRCPMTRPPRRSARSSSCPSWPWWC